MLRESFRLTVLVGSLLLLGCMAPPDVAAAAQRAGNAPAEEAPVPDLLQEAARLVEQGRYAEAEDLARNLLREAEAAHGVDSTEVSDVLEDLVEALWRGGKAAQPETRALAERAVAIRERHLGPDHPEVASSLNNLAAVLYLAGDYTAARPNWERALALFEKALGPDHHRVAAILNNLASLLRGMGEFAEARQALERALAIREKILGPEHPLVAQALNNLAGVLRSQGDYDGARALHERALEIREKVFGPDHPEVGTSLYNLAALKWNTGEYAGGVPLYRRALAVFEKALGPEHPNVALCLNSLATMLNELGDYAGAAPLYERALAIREKVLGPEHPAVAQSLNDLAVQLKETGDFVGARAAYERALAIREKALGPDHPLMAQTLNNLAVLLKVTGDFEEARSCYERALAIGERALGLEHAEVAMALNNLAILRHTMGDFKEAKRLQEQALATFEKAQGRDHPNVAMALNALAALYVETGDHARAKGLYGRALAIHETAHGPDHPNVAIDLNDLGNLLARMGEPARAMALHERALAIREKALGPRHPHVAVSLAGIASLLAAEGRVSEGLDLALRAEEIAMEHVRLTARSLAERQALQYASVRPSGLGLALTLAAWRDGESPGSAQKAWDVLLRSRALVLDEMAARRRAVAEADDPEVARLAGGLTTARRRLANLLVRGPGPRGPELYRSLIEDARREREGAERALAAKSASFREELGRTRLGLADVAGALPAGSVLVAYARYDRHDLGGEERVKGSREDGSEGTPSAPVPSYLAFVMREEDENPVVVPLCAADAIEAAVSRWKEEAGVGVKASWREPEEAEAASREAGAALRRLAWDPLVPWLEGAGRVFLVPDGALHLVSFAALPVDEGSYLVERGPLLHYLSAERDLVPRGDPGGAGKGLLALGGPAFDERGLFASLAPEPERAEEGLVEKVAALLPFRGSRSGCEGFRSHRFTPLPATEKEVRRIASLWRRRAPPAQGNREVVRLTGAAASEEAFKREVSGKRTLHLATHGFFLGGACESALAPTRGISGLVTAKESGPPAVAGENPLLLAGLALAGANHRDAAGPDEEDGILTAEEIAALDLSGVEWAVLSACETGVGEIKAGEGVFGLRRAFEVAGAGTLIMSLWSVEDEATREWMRNLYEARFVEGRDTAASVREAGLRVLKRRREAGESTHPFYWAAFVAAGEWR